MTPNKQNTPEAVDVAGSGTTFGPLNSMNALVTFTTMGESKIIPSGRYTSVLGSILGGRLVEPTVTQRPTENESGGGGIPQPIQVYRAHVSEKRGFSLLAIKGLVERWSRIRKLIRKSKPG